ncbi:MAG: LamG-like jellyroll fold domain-containing protein, partial [Planctomycetota bacterium]
SGELAIISKGGWAANDLPFELTQVPGGPTCWQFYDDGGRDSCNPPTLPEEEWHHIAGTYDGQSFKIYYDGVLEEEVAYVGTMPENTASVTIGQRSRGGCFYDGVIDEVAIYNRALSEDEIPQTMMGLSDARLASEPTPSDEATDVPRDVTLSWTPGESAPPINGHRVYFSENFDDVNDGVGGTTLSAASYTPEPRLELGTTYYWRVDEVNGAPDFTVFPGDVWSFETEPVALTIANVTATASSSALNQGPPSTVVDGSGLTDGLHSTDTQAMWSSAFGAPPPTWIQFELDRVYPLHEMRVWNSNTELESSIGYGFKDVTIEYSLDGVEYATLGTTHEFAQAPGTPDYAHNTTVDFGGLQARYVRLTANTNWALFPFPQFGLSEVRFFHIPMRARKPQPAPGATDVPVDVTVSWRAGRQAAEHNVYLSTDEQSVIDGTAPVTVVTEASHSPSSLDLGVTYYWRVDEVNATETPTTWQGDIWNFSTQEYLVVDDFESYNEIPSGEPGSKLIYETWADGFAANPATNGSAIGYLTAFSMETGIVHGGNQSAPLLYDNSVASLSEITVDPANLPIGRDWTMGAPETLVLWFYGDPGNSITEKLYVKVNGVNVDYDGDVADVARPRWKQWNIDLVALGVDLSNVTRLGIGFERTGAFGGSGTVLVDEIRLYQVAPEPPVEVWFE